MPYPDLQAMFGGASPVGGFMGAQQFQTAQTGANLENALAQQTMPTKVAQGQATLESTLLGNEQQTSKNKFDKDTYESRMQAEISKHAAQMSDDDIKQLDNFADQALRHSDPKIQAIGKQLWETSKAFREGRQKQDDVLAVGKQSQDAQKEIARTYASRPTGGGKGSGSALDLQKQAVAAYEEGDTARGDFYFQAALRLRSEGKNTPPAGSVDLNAAAGVPTIAPQPLPVFPGTNKPSPTPAPKPASLVEVQKMYPGVPPEKIKEAYKRKFGVDLQ